MFEPEDFGIGRISEENIKGGDPTLNAKIILSVLGGEEGPKMDIVLMNAAMGLLAAGAVNDIGEGVSKSREAILSGNAKGKLDQFIEMTNTGKEHA